MRLIEKQSYLFQNRGIPKENNINLIGLTLSSRKIKHRLPVNLEFDANAYVNACQENSQEVMQDIQELWNISDALGLKYSHVSANVIEMSRQYKITFYCYGE